MYIEFRWCGIPISNIILPSLHIALEDVYKSLGAQKQAWYQSFNGNHVRSTCNEKCGAFERTSHFAWTDPVDGEVNFLSNEQVIMLGKLTHGFFLCLKEHFPDASVTPKCHPSMLTC
uniref:Uncharacterized protein n=1 Tax=Ditylenchus dipsaci TaxID=166011 RepID=A0A915DJ68_9BILA